MRLDRSQLSTELSLFISADNEHASAVRSGRSLPPKTVQHLLGYSSITMTMDVYGHLFPSAYDADALAAAERRLLSTVANA